MKEAVIYARVSVRGEDINNQIENIKEWAKENGYKIVGVFPDHAVTGASDPFQRREFSNMISFCINNDIRNILVWDLARFGRSLPEAVEALRKLLDDGFTIIFTRYNLKADLNDLAGKVVIYTLLMAAELERDFMRIRMEAAKKAGKLCHRPPTPIPVEEVKKLLKKGWSLKQIHAYLIGRGLLRYKEKGTEKILSYKQFVYRLNKIGVRKRRKK
ncbi:MAG: recombinase family protein [Candidatus Njordarchaeales archaeon]